jgi:hypothetical protein
MGIMFATLLAGQMMVAATPAVDAAMYTEPTNPGRMVGGSDAVGLCAQDDVAAARDMERMAVAAFLPRSRALPICTFSIDTPWRVVRSVADRCLAPKGAEWCEVEAHAVLVEQQGRRRYAVIMVTAAQLD